MMDGTKSLQKQAIQLRLLNELSTKLQSLLDSDHFYQEVVNIVQSKFTYYGIHIFAVNPDTSYTLQAQAGAYRNHLKSGQTISAGKGIGGAVIRSKKHYLSNDVSNDTNYTDLNMPIDTKSELCVPVMKDGEV